MLSAVRWIVLLVGISLLAPSRSGNCCILQDSARFSANTPRSPSSPPIYRRSHEHIGLRDPIGLALQLGTFSGVSADIRFVRIGEVAAAIEGGWGVGVSVWGIGIGWNADLRLDIVESNDGMNDAFLLEPSIGYGHMLAIGGSNTWDDFFRDVKSLNVLCRLAWVHEFDVGIASEMALRPGIYFALEKEANNAQSSLSNRAFQLSIVTSIRF